MKDGTWDFLEIIDLAKTTERKEVDRMPIYDYRCPNCKKKFTAVLSIGEHDAGKVKCPKCGESQVQQLITAFLVKTSKKS